MSLVLPGDNTYYATAASTLTAGTLFDFTISMWVYPTAAGTRNYGGVYNAASPTTIRAYLYTAGTTGSVAVTGIWGNSSGTGTDAAPDVDTAYVIESGWNHLCIQGNRTLSATESAMEVWLNGVPSGSPSNITRDWTSGGFPDSVCLGRQIPTVTSGTPSGYIAEFAVWDSALSDEKIGELQTKTPDNIGVTPTYYVRCLDSVVATIGTNLSFPDQTMSFNAEEHPTLTGPSGGTVAPLAMVNFARMHNG